MSRTRITRLAIAASEVSLTTTLQAVAAGRGREPLTLVFIGVIGRIASDFRGDAWDVPARLEGRTATVRCIAAPPSADGNADNTLIGRCQFCPIADNLHVAVEIDCCPKLFQVLKNTAGFGGGHAGAGITLMLDLVDAAEVQRSGSEAVLRLNVTRLAVSASRTLGGSTAPAALANALPLPAAAVPVL